MKQIEFEKIHWQHRFSYGGSLRQKRKGRGARPLSSREPLHLVFKAQRERVKYGLRTYKRFSLIHHILKKYAGQFFIKVEQISIQGDHLHLLIRTTRRSRCQNFFRVFAGQIAQRFEKEGLLTATVTGTPTAPMTDTLIAPVTDTPSGKKGKARRQGPQGLWKYRPFSRVVRGYRAYRAVRNYIQLNEKEALAEIPYRASRLKGLSNSEWEILWA